VWKIRTIFSYGSRSKDILGKDNALRFDDEEVDEFGDVAHD
jgi:hypothetical protein